MGSRSPHGFSALRSKALSTVSAGTAYPWAKLPTSALAANVLKRDGYRSGRAIRAGACCRRNSAYRSSMPIALASRSRSLSRRSTACAKRSIISTAFSRGPHHRHPHPPHSRGVRAPLRPAKPVYDRGGCVYAACHDSATVKCLQGEEHHLIENASDPAHLSRDFCAEAFPIKASHKAEIGMSAEGDWGRFDWHKILGWSPFARLSAFTEMGHFHVCEYAPDLEKRSH